MKNAVLMMLLLVGCAFAVNVTGTCVTDSNSSITYCGDNSTIIIQNITIQQCNATSITLYANSTNNTATRNNVSITCLGSTQVPYCNFSRNVTLSEYPQQINDVPGLSINIPSLYGACNRNVNRVIGGAPDYFRDNVCNITVTSNATASPSTCTLASQYITPTNALQDVSICGVHVYISPMDCNQYGTQNNYNTCTSNYNACTANLNSCTASLSTANSEKTAAQNDRDSYRVQFATLGNIINSTKDELKLCKNASLSTVGLNCKNAILPVCSDSIVKLCSSDEISKNLVPDCIQRIKGENNESLMSCEIDSKSCSDTLEAYQKGDQNNSNLENIIAMVAGTLIILLGGGALVVVYLKRKSARDEIR